MNWRGNNDEDEVMEDMALNTLTLDEDCCKKGLKYIRVYE